MNKQELASRVAEASGQGRAETAQIIDTMLDIITEALARREEVRLVGFGNFVVGTRKATTGRNPRTGEPMNLAATMAPKFRVGRNLKEACNSGVAAAGL
jgi:DNA-binding protein HU-beta